MKEIFFLIFLLFSLTQQHQPACLLQEPLADQCLISVAADEVEKEVLTYLCVITSERKLYPKAQQFCKRASSISIQAGYRYFQALILINKIEKAFVSEYEMFFSDPFNHQKHINSSLNRIKDDLTEKYWQIKNNSDNYSNFEKSIILFYSNDIAGSLTSLKKHLQLSGNNSLIYEHFIMSRILEKQYQYYEGLTYIGQVVKEKTEHPYLHHLMGNFLMHHLQFQKAIQQFQKSNAGFHKIYQTGFSFSNYNIGLCYQKMGNVQDAIKYYEKSFINLNSAESLNALGHAYFSLYGKNRKNDTLRIAEKYYRKALAVHENYLVAVYNLGVLELEKKNLLGAIKLFQRCLQADVGFRSCKYGLLKAYYYKKDIKKIERIIADVQKNQQTLSELAAILYEFGDHQRALRLLGDRTDFKSSELMEWKGFNEYALEQYEHAESSFSRAVFLGSKKGYIYYSLGLAQEHLKKYRECARSFDHAYRLDALEDTKAKLDGCIKMSNNDL